MSEFSSTVVTARARMRADENEVAAELRDAENDALVAAARRRAAAFVPGAPGVCGDCEAEAPRIVAGLCVACREALGL